MNKTYSLMLIVFLCKNNILCCNIAGLDLSLLKMSLFVNIVQGNLEKVKNIIEFVGPKENFENIIFDNCCYSRKYKDLTGKDLYIPGFMPIHVAALAGKLEIFRYLVEEKKVGINIENTDSKESAVFIAASNGNLDIVDYCLSNGMDVDAKNNSEYKFFKKTLLERVLEKGYPAYCLFNFGATISEDNLKNAKEGGDKDFYRYINMVKEFDSKKTIEEKADFAVKNSSEGFEAPNITFSFKDLIKVFLLRVEKSKISIEDKNKFSKLIFRDVHEREFKINLLDSICKKNCVKLYNQPCKSKFCDVNIRFS